MNNKWPVGRVTFFYRLDVAIPGILFIVSGRRIFTKFSSASRVALPFCIERVGMITSLRYRHGDRLAFPINKNSNGLRKTDIEKEID